jgi:hypothetical protein
MVKDRPPFADPLATLPWIASSTTPTASSSMAHRCTKLKAREANRAGGTGRNRHQAILMHAKVVFSYSMRASGGGRRRHPGNPHLEDVNLERSWPILRNGLSVLLWYKPLIAWVDRWAA